MNEQSLTSSQRIDRITYLASLLSNPGDVDATLDKLRRITAKAQKPSPEDMATLSSIQSELEEYLVHKEKFRSFTKASLQAAVERHFSAADPLGTARKSAFTRIVLTVLAAAGLTGILFALRVMQGQVVLAFFICTLFVGLALFFQSFKKDLVAQLRGSVNYLMAATIGTGLFALNFPIIAANAHWEKLPIFQHGGFLEAAIPVYACYYAAFYLYAKQLDVKIPQILRPLGVLITCVGITVLSIVAPHPVAVPDELYFDLAVIGFAVSVYLSGIAAVLGFMAVPKTTTLYSKTTIFLAVSMVLQTIGNGNFLIFVTYVSGDFSVNDQKGQILTAMFIMGALLFQYVAAYKSRTALR
jgi:hypothetical protein